VPRWGLVLVLVVLLGISVLLRDRVADRVQSPTVISDYRPDSTMENFTRWAMDEQGVPKSRLKARFMAHFPHDDSSEFEQPQVELYRTVGKPWHVIAESAWVDGSGDVMILYGEVTIWRENDDGSRLELITRDLKILLDNEYAETEHPVSLIDKSSVIDAVGMRADFSKNRIEFMDEVKSRHVPSKKG
jgi:lipopolysaccharide export system protein LptC